MRSSLYFSLISSLLATFISGCRKDDKDDRVKICREGPLVYKSGTEFLTLTSAFTPNGDGINDAFIGRTNIPYDRLKIRIYQPDGTLLYESDDKGIVWIPSEAISDTYYQLFTETTILTDDSNELKRCSPLYVLRLSPDKRCIYNAKAEDTTAYVFPDQLLPDGSIWPTSYECIQF